MAKHWLWLALVVVLVLPGRAGAQVDDLCDAAVTVIGLDAGGDGRFVRTDAEGNPISSSFGSTEVWITGGVGPHVSVLLMEAAAVMLRDNDPLTFVNRTDGAICLDLDLTPAVAVLSADVVREGDLLVLGGTVRIDLTSIDTLTIGDQTVPVAGLAEIVSAGIRTIPTATPDATEAVDVTPDATEVMDGCAAITADLDGAALRSVLYTIASDGHDPLSYSPGVREALRYTDRDPDNDANVRLFYVNRSQPIFTFDSDNTSMTEDDQWNREHLWPQSHGARDGAPRTDLHHIRASDKSVNNDRGNQDFGEVDEIAAYAATDRPGGAIVADTFDNDRFWEPRDDIKGDVARAMFYMDVRYEGGSGEPDLVLVNGDTGNFNGQTELGDLATLLAWHLADPVSAEEIARHERVFEVQGNINPFIVCRVDVSRLWG